MSRPASPRRGCERPVRSPSRKSSDVCRGPVTACRRSKSYTDTGYLLPTAVAGCQPLSSSHHQSITSNSDLWDSLESESFELSTLL